MCTYKIETTLQIGKTLRENALLNHKLTSKKNVTKAMHTVEGALV